MTSIPASRNARAITLAPRSWPSRPGFAITTRILCVISTLSLSRGPQWTRGVQLYLRCLFPLAPHVAHGVAHLSDGGVRTHGVDDGGHGVVAAACRGPKSLQRPLHRVLVPGLPECLEPV